MGLFFIFFVNSQALIIHKGKNNLSFRERKAFLGFLKWSMINGFIKKRTVHLNVKQNMYNAFFLILKLFFFFLHLLHSIIKIAFALFFLSLRFSRLFRVWLERAAQPTGTGLPSFLLKPCSLQVSPPETI